MVHHHSGDCAGGAPAGGGSPAGGAPLSPSPLDERLLHWRDLYAVPFLLLLFHYRRSRAIPGGYGRFTGSPPFAHFREDEGGDNDPYPTITRVMHQLEGTGVVVLGMDRGVCSLARCRGMSSDELFQFTPHGVRSLDRQHQEMMRVVRAAGLADGSGGPRPGGGPRPVREPEVLWRLAREVGRDHARTLFLLQLYCHADRYLGDPEWAVTFENGTLFRWLFAPMLAERGE